MHIEAGEIWVWWHSSLTGPEGEVQHPQKQELSSLMEMLIQCRLTTSLLKNLKTINQNLSCWVWKQTSSHSEHSKHELTEEAFTNESVTLMTSFVGNSHVWLECGYKTYGTTQVFHRTRVAVLPCLRQVLGRIQLHPCPMMQSLATFPAPLQHWSDPLEAHKPPEIAIHACKIEGWRKAVLQPTL